MKPRDLTRDPFARMNDGAEEALAAATARVHSPRERQAIPVIPDDVTTCSACGAPAHASETDDLDRCVACADASCMVSYQTSPVRIDSIAIVGPAHERPPLSPSSSLPSLAQLVTLPGTAPAVATGATVRELIALEHDDCATCGCALDGEGACPNG